MKQNHFAPLVELYLHAGPARYNLVTSAVLSVFEFIRSVCGHSGGSESYELHVIFCFSSDVVALFKGFPQISQNCK